MKIEDIDELFRLMDKMMNQPFSGAYKRQDKNPEFSEDDEEDQESIDIYEDKNHIYITIELRGLTEDDFNILIEPYNFILEVFVDGQWYSDKFKLPHKVKRKGKVEFNNCILDVILTKDKEKNERKKGNRGAGRIDTDRENTPEVV